MAPSRNHGSVCRVSSILIYERAACTITVGNEMNALRTAAFSVLALASIAAQAADFYFGGTGDHVRQRLVRQPEDKGLPNRAWVFVLVLDTDPQVCFPDEVIRRGLGKVRRAPSDGA